MINFIHDIRFKKSFSSQATIINILLYFISDNESAVYLLIQKENVDEAKRWCWEQGQPDTTFIEKPDKEFHDDLKAKYER